MSNRHPWTAWYWDEWDTDTAALSDSEYAIYHRLLKHYYKSQKPIQAIASSLPRLCLAFDEPQMLALASVLHQFFELRDGFYHNKRADMELGRMISISKQRAKAGSKGGSKRKAIAKQLPTHPQPHTHIESKAINHVRPTLQEVILYCQERGNSVDPQRWFDHYTSNGWKVGKNPMKVWQAAVRTWEKNSGGQNGGLSKAQERTQRGQQAILDAARNHARQRTGIDPAECEVGGRTLAHD